MQLRAAKNNVRPPHWMKPRGADQQQQGAGAAVLPPTPLYNLAILEDMVLLLHHRLLGKALGSSQVLRQTVLLLKVRPSMGSTCLCAEIVKTIIYLLMVVLCCLV